jgi:hypothetical protein
MLVHARTKILSLDSRPSLFRRNRGEHRAEVDASARQGRKGQGLRQAPGRPQIAEERRRNVRDLEKRLAEAGPSGMLYTHYF